MGSSVSGKTSPNFSGLSRCASTRIAALSTPCAFPAPLRPALDRSEQIVERTEEYRSVIWPRRTTPTTRGSNVRAARHIHLVSRRFMSRPASIIFGIHWETSADGRRKPLLPAFNPVTAPPPPRGLSETRVNVRRKVRRI